MKEYVELNQVEDKENYISFIIIIPERVPEDFPEYLVHMKPNDTILDLKKLLKSELKTKPKTFNIRIIRLGKVLDNTTLIKDVIKRNEESNTSTNDNLEYSHLHVMISDVPIFSGNSSTKSTSEASQAFQSTRSSSFQGRSQPLINQNDFTPRQRELEILSSSNEELNRAMNTQMAPLTRDVQDFGHQAEPLNSDFSNSLTNSSNFRIINENNTLSHHNLPSDGLSMNQHTNVRTPSFSQLFYENPDVVYHSDFYQHVTIHGRRYLMKVPNPFLHPSRSEHRNFGSFDPQPGNIRMNSPNFSLPQPNNTRMNPPRLSNPRPRRSLLFRTFQFLRFIWPVIKFVIKFSILYLILGAGTDSYKQVLFIIVFLIFLIFHNGIVDIQIEFGRADEINERREALQNQNRNNNNNNNNNNRPHDNNGQQGTNNIPENENLAQEQVHPRDPRHPIVEGILTFFTSLLPPPGAPAANRNNDAAPAAPAPVEGARPFGF